MKKFIVFTLILVALFLLALGIFLAMLFWPVAIAEGPKTYYRVDEGSVEVFGFKDGEARSLLGVLHPGEKLMAPSISEDSLKVQYWLTWLEPVVVDAVGRAQHFMYTEGKKTNRNEFTVGYTNQSIRKGFVQALERSGVLENFQLSFFPNEFSLFAQVLGVSVSARGSVSTPDESGKKLFLSLKWFKIGGVMVPENGLRALENLFANAYAQSGNLSTKLLKINLKENAMVMSFRKTAESN